MRSVKGLSDRELVSQLRHLVKKEHNITINILAHLAEIRRRELYLAKAYNSLYEYCRSELGYTDASAWRRANAAESITKCPEALELLKAGRVNLSTLATISRIVTPRILQKICGKSKTEVELLVAAWDPKRAVPDRTRPLMVPRLAGEIDGVATSGDRRSLVSAVARPSPTDNDASALSAKSLRSEVEHQKHIVSEVPHSGIPSRERLEFEHKWKIEGVVSKTVKEKLDRCKSLLSGKYPSGVDYNTLLDELTELFLTRKDPDRRAERRKQREKKHQHPTKAASKTTGSCHIPAREKEKVWVRDKGRCAYTGSDGRRCNSTHNLQYDHYPIPYAKGGANRADNLRLLCARHNRDSAERIYGKTHMREYLNHCIE